jgi:hypothetical protein
MRSRLSDTLELFIESAECRAGTSTHAARTRCRSTVVGGFGRQDVGCRSWSTLFGGSSSATCSRSGCIGGCDWFRGGLRTFFRHIKLLVFFVAIVRRSLLSACSSLRSSFCCSFRRRRPCLPCGWWDCSAYRYRRKDRSWCCLLFRGRGFGDLDRGSS